MRGTVTDFDPRRGLGTVTAEDGSVFGFHCTQIADGTRTVEVGAPVEFEVAPGPPGRWEARAVRAGPGGATSSPASR
jgi:CspA family cold shock protein